MERKRRIRRYGLVLIILGTAAVGGMIGAVVYLTNPDLIPLPTPATQPPPTVAVGPSATAAPSWRVTFEYRFDTGAFTSGRHAYVISANCPGTVGSGSWRSTFEVSGAAPVRGNRVYLRTVGAMSAPIGGEPVGPVHPEQSLGAAASFTFATLDAAEAARATCQLSVQPDGGPSFRMEPGLPKEQAGG